MSETVNSSGKKEKEKQKGLCSDQGIYLQDEVLSMKDEVLSTNVVRHHCLGLSRFFRDKVS